MSLTGNLRTMQLSDLLQWCALNSKTGTLRIRHAPIEKRLFFKAGRLFSSTSNNPRERLSQFLIRSGRITEEQLFQALIRQGRTRKRLGEVLIGLGWLDEPELNKLLKLKTEESIYDCFLWSDGDFAFEDDRLPEDIAVFISADLTTVVMEGARRADEWRRIRQVFPSLEVTFTVTKGGVAAAVSQDDRRILSLVEGGRSIAEIALELHAVDFYAVSRLWNLHERGLIGIDRIRQEIPFEKQVQEVSNRLREGQSLLKAGRLTEALAAFEKAVRMDPRDRYARLLLIKVKGMMKQTKEVDTIPHDAVLAVRAPVRAMEDLDLDPKACFVLSRINGRWDVGSIMKICPMSEEEVLVILRRLLDCSLIEFARKTDSARPCPSSAPKGVAG